MEWDAQMASDPRDVENTGMRAKTSNLNDELALIKYVFSDKTGTLTGFFFRFVCLLLIILLPLVLFLIPFFLK